MNDEKQAPLEAKVIDTPELATKEDILAEFVKRLPDCGLVGQLISAKLLYLLMTSRLLAKPASGAIRGDSGIGKSHFVDTVSKFFPETAYYRISGMSPKALVNWPEAKPLVD